MGRSRGLGFVRLSGVCLLLLGVGAGCSGSDTEAGEGLDPFGGVVGDGDTGGGDGDSGGGGGGDGDSLLTGTSGDGPSGGLVSGPDANVCKHVDLIISVDGSGSMTEELQAIRDEVFPAFADRLLEVGVGLDDFRVGTLDACPSPANLHTRGTGGQCNFEGGNVWIESSSSNMRDEFACVGAIFQDDHNCSGNNDDEQPASAAAKALESEFGGGVNSGFSRYDSLLVVIAITDEDEQPTETDQNAQAVYNRLVAAKGGDASRVVFLGIGGGGGGGGQNPFEDCQGPYGGAQEASVLRGITEQFGPRGFFWDLCEGRLEDSLDEVFAIIERACDDLPPPPDVPPELSDGPV